MFEFRLAPHPSRVEVHGQLVPLIQDVQMIQVKEGERWVQCGYCGKEPGRPVSLTRHYPEIFRHAVKEFVEAEVGTAKSVAMPPAPKEESEVDDE